MVQILMFFCCCFGLGDEGFGEWRRLVGEGRGVKITPSENSTSNLFKRGTVQRAERSP